MEQRKYPRFSHSFHILFNGERVHGYGRVINISLGGCAVHSVFQVDSGISLRLTCYLPDGGDPLEVASATVRWSHGEIFGVEFLHMAAEAQERLHEFLDMLTRPNQGLT